ncbi:DNA polymerase III subunit delta' [Spiribacter sp. 221]|uniref:DNA polymerase III subunit delta' n=1 Tax=Spiribacter onubensis TaxID=3122420 RepID=UPI00349F7E1F
MDEGPGLKAPLPWQADAWRRFLSATEAGRVPHAIMLGGVAGTGKRELALAMLARLLCEAPGSGGACGTCRGCRLRIAGSHPDQMLIEPESDGSGVLRIESARALTEFTHRTSQYNGYRVARVMPAEAMNRHTANALLKTLEEPPAGMVIILVSHEPGRLGATIRSRCQHYRLGTPAPALSIEWLQRRGVGKAGEVLELAGGSPLTALELAGENGTGQLDSLVAAIDAVASGRRGVVEAAAEWQAVGALQTARLMQRIATQLMRAQADPRAARNGLAKAPGLQARLDLKRISRIADRLLALRGAADQSLSRELSMEALFLVWSEG